jgi:SAM-dependent methyltransferase
MVQTASQDIIIFQYSLHDIYDYKGAIKEAARICKIGGSILIHLFYHGGMEGRFHRLEEIPGGVLSRIKEQSYIEVKKYKLNNKEIEIKTNFYNRPLKHYNNALRANDYSIQECRLFNKNGSYINYSEIYNPEQEIIVLIHAVKS